MTRNRKEYLVQQGSAQRAALREQTDRTQFGLGKTAVADKHRVHVARIVDSHAVRSDDTALVLIRQTHNLLLSIQPRLENPLLLRFPPSYRSHGNLQEQW